jgi:hypothetical protein
VTLQYEIENDSETQAAPILANPVLQAKSHELATQIPVPPDGAPHASHRDPQ